MQNIKYVFEIYRQERSEYVCKKMEYVRKDEIYSRICTVDNIQ